MTTPQAVLDAVQEHIDRTEADYRSQYHHNTEACNALGQGKKLGMLQQWVYEQKRATGD